MLAAAAALLEGPGDNRRVTSDPFLVPNAEGGDLVLGEGCRRTGERSRRLSWVVGELGFAFRPRFGLWDPGLRRLTDCFAWSLG